MIEQVDCVVVGAGVVGLAVARALAEAGRDVVIVEAADAVGCGVSSRNSEVIHAGIHYPPGSLKARFCVRGKQLLYAYCAERHVPHRRLGKLIVATDVRGIDRLHHIVTAGREAGVDDLELLDVAQVARLEPDVACHGAVWSPSTGIVDSHALMQALLADAEAAGATLALSSRVSGGAARSDGITLDVVSGPERVAIRAAVVVNCASLDASRLAHAIAGVPAASIPDTHAVKGNYFSLVGRAPFRHLVYPLPESDGVGLGIHLTLDLAGQARFGPDVEWPQPQMEAAIGPSRGDAGTLDYAVHPERAEAFAAAIRRYWPALPQDALLPAYAGMRPRISARHETARDFVIAGPNDHGVAGLVHLFGIESPGLTSALAIGEHVTALLTGRTAPR